MWAMSIPVAYLITWTTHGSWLHGDVRGSVARQGENHPDGPVIAPNAARVRFERSELKRPALLLDLPRRTIVRATIRKHAGIRAWDLIALNVRSNHVHVVLACPCSPEKAMGELKAWCSRRLRESGAIEGDVRVWTRHGSTRHLFDPQAVSSAIGYVTDGQGPDLR